MAYVYCTIVHCDNLWKTQAICNYLNGLIYPIYNSIIGVSESTQFCRLNVGIVEANDPLDSKCLLICPSNVTEDGLGSDEDREKAYQYNNFIEGLLKNFDFDWALSGVEVSEDIFFQDLIDLANLENMDSSWDGYAVPRENAPPKSKSSWVNTVKKMYGGLLVNEVYYQKMKENIPNLDLLGMLKFERYYQVPRLEFSKTNLFAVVRDAKQKAKQS